ncbi:unnamed protein product [Eruca vesicaria subsp. sativa]|uniref:Uncharacterized protein n=1 Tax=Eruca vesicaria subsp. sativa TaxID=29727 RepID=A0ABC8JQN3_ERUVS|nr:unnamed protein product [Eruca vesicaria subsp. sativa]
MDLYRSSKIILLILSILSPAAFLMRYELLSGHMKCISEEIHANAILVGKYSIEEKNTEGKEGDEDEKHEALPKESKHHTRERGTKEESSSSPPRKQCSLLSASFTTLPCLILLPLVIFLIKKKPCFLITFVLPVLVALPRDLNLCMY